MKIGIFIFEHIVVVDGRVFLLAAREAEYLGEYASAPHLTANKRWGKKLRLSDLDALHRLRVAALLRECCMKPDVHEMLTPGHKLFLR